MENFKIDCIKMKEKIQKQLREEREGKTDEEIEAIIDERIEQSDSPVARLWKRMTRKVA